MTALRLLALAVLLSIPAVASGQAMTQVADTQGTEILTYGDFNGDGKDEVLCYGRDGGPDRLLLRDLSTGVLWKRFEGTYSRSAAFQLTIVDMDQDGLYEILFWDLDSQVIAFEVPTMGTPYSMTPTWSFAYPARPGAASFQPGFAKLDGVHVFMVYQEPGASGVGDLKIRNSTGGQVQAISTSIIDPSFDFDDADGDSKVEILVTTSQGYPDYDRLQVYRWTAPVAVEQQERTNPALQLMSANPARGEMKLSYTMPASDDANLSVFDVQGRMVRTLARGRIGAGRHIAEWNGEDDRGARLDGGVYFVRLSAAGHEYGRKVVWLK